MTPDTHSLETLANGLGWFSIGLGAMEMAAPHAMARRIGLKDHDRLLRVYGAREVATGIGLLAARREQKPLWLWGRVAGDALDVLTLARGMTEVGPRKRQRAALALGAVMGVAALDALCAWKLGEAEAMRRRRPAADYSRRSGFPHGVATARGSARDAEIPQDMLTPDALRPYAVP